MLRAVVDTQCLIASVGPDSPFRALYDLFAAEEFEWVVSSEILTEYEEVLTRRYSPLTADVVLNALMFAPNTYHQEAYYKWQLVIADPDDNKFVDVAVAASADFLVSNDRHFQFLRQLPFPQVSLVSFQEFLASFQK